MFEKGNRGNTLHGILLIALFSFAAFYIAEIPFVRSLSFSPLIVGIILGMLYANSLRNRLPETWVPGIKFCTKQILRSGIVLYGFRLTLTQVAAVGLPAIIIDTIIVCGTIGLGVWLGRALKMDKDTSLMTATGSAICGAAAVLGAEPVVKCEGHKTAIAVSTVVIFGTISMFLYPIMYRAGLLDALGNIGTAIRATTTGRIPLKMRITTGLSWYPVKSIAISNIMSIDGRTLATVATMLPLVPFSLYPVKMAMFTARSPGAVWERAIMSGKSSSLSHPLPTISLCISGIIAMPPPIVNAPIFAKIRNICQYVAIMYLLSVCEGSSRGAFGQNPDCGDK